MTKRLLFSILICLASVNCQKSDDPLATPVDDGSAAQQITNAKALFDDSVGSFEVWVVYEAGAEPYVGNISGTTTPVWELTKKTFAALFNNHVGRFMFVPNILGQMIQIPDQGKTSWSQVDLIKLGRDNAPDLIQAGDARITIIFLNGSLAGDPSALGYHPLGARFAFVFKDAVASSSADAKTLAYLEQSVVVHELGHVSGLVNNGVPMITNHEDPAHPKHSKNAECAMNYKIENKATAVGALSNAISGNRQVLFGSETLVDGRSYHSGP